MCSLSLTFCLLDNHLPFRNLYQKYSKKWNKLQHLLTKVTIGGTEEHFHYVPPLQFSKAQMPLYRFEKIKCIVFHHKEEHLKSEILLIKSVWSCLSLSSIYRRIPRPSLKVKRRFNCRLDKWDILLNAPKWSQGNI